MFHGSLRPIDKCSLTELLIYSYNWDGAYAEIQRTLLHANFAYVLRNLVEQMKMLKEIF